jgi:hypothetical protein
MCRLFSEFVRPAGRAQRLRVVDDVLTLCRGTDGVCCSFFWNVWHEAAMSNEAAV